MIRLVVRRRAEPQPAEQLLEIVSPRTNSALISAAEHLCGALTLQTRAPAGGPLALEIIADRARRWFLIRTQSIPQQRQLRGQIGAAYPQATLSPLGPALLPTGDPARVGTDEQVAACTMGLRAGDHLPLRTFLDRDLDSDQGPAQIARGIVGQPRSTLDFREMIARGKIVLVNLNAFDVGEDTAALLGGTLLNLAARAVSAQSALTPEQRKSVTIAVDEFHTIPGADYEQVFGELAKYGANMILATQTLARLDRLSEAERTRDLRGVVFSNLDGLFAFHTSAEDARFLAPELGGELTDQDLLELGHYQCYARLTDVRTGERLPAFTVRLDPPPAGDATMAPRLADDSAERYGRDALDVDLDLQSAWERIHGPAAVGKTASYPQPDQAVPSGSGGTASDRAVSGGQLPAPRPAARGKKASRRRSRPAPPREGTDSGDGTAAA